MSRRLGIDLSSDVVALADVREPRRGRIQLRDFDVLDTGRDAASLAADLRRARKKHRFPKNAEVVAWAGDGRVQAVRDAGFVIERVVTPGEALARVERMHRGMAAPASNTAMIALHASGGALAIVHQGEVRHETPLTWSAQTAASLGNPDLLRRYAFLSELTELLRGSFDAAARVTGRPVTDILTCGSLPELRSFTMPLADEFDVEVETLDSADDLDVRVKGPTFDLALESIAALRIAIAAGRRWHGRPSAVRKVLRVAVPAGLAAGAFYALAIWGFSAASGPTPLEQQARVSATSRGEPAPQRAAQARPRPAAPAPERATAQPPAVAVARAPVSTPPPAVSTPPPAVSTPAPAVSPPPAVSRPASAAPAPARVAPSAPPPSERVATAAHVEPVERREPIRAAAFTVSSILWSEGRQLAIVDGQIFGVGDVIDGARIVEIQPDAVLARDRAGRLRRAQLSPQGPP